MAPWRRSRRAVVQALRRGGAALAQGRFTAAVGWYAKAAAAGDPEAQFQIGLLYARGHGVVRSLGDGVAWWGRAGESGHAEAQYQLALAHLHGGESAGGARAWYELAAALDREIAERNRELLFPHGITVPADPREALAWCRAAAEQGHAQAQGTLALMYARGLGCEI